MFQNLDIFQTAGRMAAHAGRRQALLSQNVANADTPGYKAVDLPAFAATEKKTSFSHAMVATRSSHLQGVARGQSHVEAFERPAEADPNGNTVALDLELMYAVEAKRHHDRALAIYRSSLDILRTAIRVR